MPFGWYVPPLLFQCQTPPSNVCFLQRRSAAQFQQQSMLHHGRALTCETAEGEQCSHNGSHCCSLFGSPTFRSRRTLDEPWPALAEVWPTTVEHGRTRITFHLGPGLRRNAPSLGRARPASTQFWATSTESGATSARIGGAAEGQSGPHGPFVTRSHMLGSRTGRRANWPQTESCLVISRSESGRTTCVALQQLIISPSQSPVCDTLLLYVRTAT